MHNHHDTTAEAADRAADFVSAELAEQPSGKPRIGVILGSGLGSAAEVLAESHDQLSLRYNDIPGMPVPAIAGHPGELTIVSHESATIFLLRGRVHAYEGHSLASITFAVRMLHKLGVSQLVITNAAGSLRREFLPGHLMLIRSHIVWPSIGLPRKHAQPEQSIDAADEHDGCRAPGIGSREIWCPEMLQLATEVPWSGSTHQGVYAMMQGPSYETPAEVRAAGILGADVVGMSSVPEAIAASELGMSVLGVSCISNIACGCGDGGPLLHSHVTETVASVQHELSRWLRDVVLKFATTT